MFQRIKKKKKRTKIPDNNRKEMEREIICSEVLKILSRRIYVT